MNNLLNSLKQESNKTLTEKGAVTYRSTLNPVLDLFALGGATRQWTSREIISKLVAPALAANEELTMKCLFYLRDIRGGQGCRNLFRVAYHYCLENDYDIAVRNLKNIPEYGRWDDLIEVAWNTKYWNKALDVIEEQIEKDVAALAANQPVSLLGKWLPKEQGNTLTERNQAVSIAKRLQLTPRNYRKIVSKLRAAIHIVETDLTERNYDNIDFAKLPSQAGFRYADLFARLPQTAARYESFINNKETKVNAGTLYPADVGAYLRKCGSDDALANKYWENLTDYFNGATLNAVCVIDTSGSMTWGGSSKVQPIDVACSLGYYAATRCNENSPFYRHYISFSEHPTLVEIKGDNFAAAYTEIMSRNECANTDLEKTFDLLIDTIVEHNLKEEDIPESVIIISDMQFDAGTTMFYPTRQQRKTLMENIRNKYETETGYKFPKVVYWNVSASNKSIPELPEDGISFVSGYSPSIFTALLTGKTSLDLMLEVLNSERYSPIF